MKKCIGLLAAFYASLLLAAPYAVMEDGNSVVTLNDDKCTLPFLKGDYRTATWREGDKVFKGCWGVNSLGIVIIWTDDKAISAIPGQYFKKAEGI